jgi:hypothetical protein
MMTTHLDIYQLLDRFELLYSDNKDLTDLRRAYIDKDLNSIFRLIANGVEPEDLRKVILEDNYWALWKILQECNSTQFVAAFKNFYVNNTEFADDCFSRGQLESKLWLVNNIVDLKIPLGTVYLCAGWYGTLATMLFESGTSIESIRSFDIDESCVAIAEVFNKPWVMENWKFKSITQNINDINFESHSWQVWSNKNNRYSHPIVESPDTIINTSCEHISNFDEWYAKIPEGRLVVLQSNDYFEIKEHVNCSKDLEAFSIQTPMKTELFSGELLLPKYKRFMRIGHK